jgi:hypothetical protein
MATVTAYPDDVWGPRATKQRLSVFLAASLLAHLCVIALITGMLQPLELKPLARPGQISPLEIALIRLRPIAFDPPPETPVLAAELPSTEPPLPAKAVDMKPIPPVPPIAEARRDEPPSRVESPRATLDTEPSPDAAATDSPPPGDVAVGALDESARVGRTQSLRLAQRFPARVEKRPQLRAPLVVPYPPRAARARAEIRIAALVLLDAEGRKTETSLYPDDALFAPTVLAALDGAQFTPAEIDGKPVPYWTILDFIFTMRPPARPR